VSFAFFLSEFAIFAQFIGIFRRWRLLSQSRTVVLVGSGVAIVGVGVGIGIGCQLIVGLG
jgi:hypothetical protein